MKFENTEVFNLSGALRGMRNPKESWSKSDSYWDLSENPGRFFVGDDDMRLAQTLIKAGSEHRKFLRQIFVSVDITAPLFWWKEFDTYKVGTTANSTSTMHKMASKPITIDCFEIDDYDPLIGLIDPVPLDIRVGSFINDLEQLRQLHLQYKEESEKEGISFQKKKELEKLSKKYWKELIRWLPESWLQTRTVTMTYENLFAMCSKGQRRNHKLNEWSGIDDATLTHFTKWARTLPYAQQFIFIDEDIKRGEEGRKAG